MTAKNDIVKKYFDAWDQHNADTILTTFAEGGTYCDPATEKEITGQQIGEYAQSLFDAFSDMSVELISSVEASNGEIAAPWLIFGTNDGPIMGKPPTGKHVVIQGCDFIKTEGGLLTTVVGVWDTKDLFAQLGLSG